MFGDKTLLYMFYQMDRARLDLMKSLTNFNN